MGNTSTNAVGLLFLSEQANKNKNPVLNLKLETYAT